MPFGTDTLSLLWKNMIVDHYDVHPEMVQLIVSSTKVAHASFAPWILR